MAEAMVEETKAAPEERGSVKPKRNRARILVAVVLPILAVGGYFLWSYWNSYESTDDAQVNGHVNAVSARISGQVASVTVLSEQQVKAGDVLVKIDPRDYEVAVAKAEADLAGAEAELQSAKTDVPITTANTASLLKTAHSGRADAGASLLGAQRQLNAASARLQSAQAQVQEAEANYKKAADDVERYKQLVGKEEISRQQYDQAVQTAAAAKATVDSKRASVNEARQNITVAETNIEQARARIGQAEATVQSAMTAPQQVLVSQAKARSAAAKLLEKQAALDQAKLNLSYTTIAAPVSGVVGKKSVEVGQNVAPGQQLMAIVPLDDIWITANFKETQLRRMKPGQKVKISVDAYGRDYTGQGDGDRRGDGGAVQSAAAGERDGELREGGAADSGADRPRPRPERRSPFAAGNVGDADGGAAIAGGRRTRETRNDHERRSHACMEAEHNEWAIALTVTMATFMEVLDTSIANVALPHIAGNLSAGQDESTWVLTSYLVSNAIVLPISAWLATRLGRKRFYMTCVALFGVSSPAVRAGAELACWFSSACCRARAAEDWRRASRRFWPTRSRRPNAAWRSPSTAWRWCWRRRSGRRWAATSPTISIGAGSSSSTCRWRWCR